MGRLIVRRTLWSIPILLIATFLLFWMVRSAFDPTARFRASQDPQVIEEQRERLGLNKPIVSQYGTWLRDLSRGDWGESSRNSQPVDETIRKAMGNTMQLVAWGVLVSATIAIAIGVYSAVKQYSLGDYAFTGLTYIGISMPPFWFALIAIHFLAVKPKDWFGLSEVPLFYNGLGEAGFNLDYFKHLVLPVLTLSVQLIASWARYQRASTLEVLGSDYIRTARAKGVPRRRVIFRHAVRNALIPLVTVMAIDVGLLFGGLIITESIFSIPGMGKLFIDSLLEGDMPVLEAWVLVVGLFILVFNLLADLIYGVLDPRVRVR